MFKSDSDNQGGEESAYGGMGSSFSDKAIRLNFIRKVIVMIVMMVVMLAIVVVILMLLMGR